jgi:hypothetical protein
VCVHDLNCAQQRHPNASLAAQLKALVARNKARAAKLDPSALPEDEQKRLRELKDIKSDYRLPKATTAGDAQDKRKQQGPSPPRPRILHFVLLRSF